MGVFRKTAAIDYFGMSEIYHVTVCVRVRCFTTNP